MPLSPNKNEVGEREGRKIWCADNRGQKWWVGGSCGSENTGENEVVLITLSQKELIFLEFLRNFPCNNTWGKLQTRSFPLSSFNPMTKTYFHIYFPSWLGVTITQSKVCNLPLSPTWLTRKDSTYHSGCLSGNSVNSPSIGDTFELLFNYCLYFSR